MLSSVFTFVWFESFLIPTHSTCGTSVYVCVSLEFWIIIHLRPLMNYIVFLQTPVIITAAVQTVNDDRASQFFLF